MHLFHTCVFHLTEEWQLRSIYCSFYLWDDEFRSSNNKDFVSRNKLENCKWKIDILNIELYEDYQRAIGGPDNDRDRSVNGTRPKKLPVCFDDKSNHNFDFTYFQKSSGDQIRTKGRLEGQHGNLWQYTIGEKEWREEGKPRKRGEQKYNNNRWLKLIKNILKK